jgi:hypothetical protein
MEKNATSLQILSHGINPKKDIALMLPALTTPNNGYGVKLLHSLSGARYLKMININLTPTACRKNVGTLTMEKQGLQSIAKAIRAMDESGWLNKDSEEKRRWDEARARLINIIFSNGYELQSNTSRLTKSNYKRNLMPETHV